MITLTLTMDTKYDNNEVTRWQGENSKSKNDTMTAVRSDDDKMTSRAWSSRPAMCRRVGARSIIRAGVWNDQSIVTMILIWERITCLWGNIDRNAWTPHQHWDANVKLIWLPWLFQLMVVYGCLSFIIMMQDVYSVWHRVIFFWMVILALRPLVNRHAKLAKVVPVVTCIDEIRVLHLKKKSGLSSMAPT